MNGEKGFGKSRSGVSRKASADSENSEFTAGPAFERIACDILLMHDRTYGQPGIHSRNFADQMRSAGCSIVQPVVQSLIGEGLITERHDAYQQAIVYDFSPDRIQRFLEQYVSASSQFCFAHLGVEDQSRVLKRMQETGVPDTPANRERTWHRVQQERDPAELDSETLVSLVKTKRIAEYSKDSEKRSMANAVMGLFEQQNKTKPPKGGKDNTESPRRVTPSEVARFLDINRTSLVTKTWPQPTIPNRGSRPAEYDWCELRPELEDQYPKTDWSSF